MSTSSQTDTLGLGLWGDHDIIDPTDVNNNMQRLEEALANTGWIDLTYASSVTQGDYGGPLQMRKIGNHVFIRGGIAGTWNGTDNLQIISGSIPSGFRPVSNTHRFNVLTGSNIARTIMTYYGAFYIQWIKRLSDGADVTSELSWIIVDIDYFVD